MIKIEKTSIDFREAADKVWDIAKEYELSDHKDIANVLKQLAEELHELARHKESLEKK